MTEKAAVELTDAIFAYAVNRVGNIWSQINPDREMPDFRNNAEYSNCISAMALACHKTLKFAIDTQDTTG